LYRFSTRLILLLTLLGAVFGYAQDAPTSVKIDTIEVVGNERTQDSVILRELHFNPPCEVDQEDLEIIQNRLSNLFIFNRVQVGVFEMDDKNILQIQVTETWYLYPVPILFLNDREWDRISYGFKLTHYNFRGMNEKLNVGGWLGFNPSFFLSYNNPWVGTKSRLIMRGSVFGKRTQNRFSDVTGEGFQDRQLGGSVTLGKRLTLNTSLRASFGMRRIEFPDDKISFSESGTKVDIFPTASLTLSTDHRDLREYPRSGYSARYSLIRGGFTENQADFWRWEMDNRVYIPLHKRFSLAARNLLKLNRGQQPTYSYTFLGFGERIRGYFDRRLPAQNLMLQNLEMRISLLPVRYFSWKDAPLMSQLFQDMKFGISMGLHMDSGTVWERSREIAIDNFLTGYGVGLHLHLPHIYLLRIDHTWSDQGRGEWLIEGGVSF